MKAEGTEVPGTGVGPAEIRPSSTTVSTMGLESMLTEAVEVPVTDYPQLGVEDFMVSLYNGHTVQRVRVALPDGGRADVHEVLETALAALG